MQSQTPLSVRRLPMGPRRRAEAAAGSSTCARTSANSREKRRSTAEHVHVREESMVASASRTYVSAMQRHRRPVPAQMWEGRAQSRCRCGRREPKSRRRCGRGTQSRRRCGHRPGGSLVSSVSIASPSGVSTGSAGNGCGLVLQSGICLRNGSPTRVEVHPSRRGCVSSTRKQASQGYAPAPAGHAARSCWRSPLVGHTSTEMICSSRST